MNKDEENESEEHQAFKWGINLQYLHHPAHELVVYLRYPEYLHQTRDFDQLLKFAQAGQPRNSIDPWGRVWRPWISTTEHHNQVEWDKRDQIY